MEGPLATTSLRGLTPSPATLAFRTYPEESDNNNHSKKVDQ